MAVLRLILGPDPILRTKAKPVISITDETKQIIADMLETLYERRAIGIGANMVGVTERIIVVDLQENGDRKPLVCLNPEILWTSEEQQENEEASLCYPGISAKVTRPNSIKIQYLGEDGDDHQLEAEGWLAAVIQHEMEYLDGRCYLDNLSKMQKDRLIKKMQKQLKTHHCGEPHCHLEH